MAGEETEKVRAGNDLQKSSSSFPLGTSFTINLLKASFNMTFNTSNDGPPTTPLGNLFQSLTTVIVKIPYVQVKSITLKPLPLVLPLRPW